MVLVTWWETSDIKEAFIFSLFFLFGLAFNYNIIYTYRSLKSNKFHLNEVSEEINWHYILISTPSIIVLFYFLIPYPLQIVGIIVSICVLIGLFLLDLILNGLR